MLHPIQWTGAAVRLLDQTRLPTETVYLDITDEKQMWDAIQRLVVRGAPAIGIAAAFGVYLGVRHQHLDNPDAFFKRLDDVCAYLATSRPTAVNLFWALERVKRVAHEIRGTTATASAPCHLVRDVQDALLDEALRMIEEDHQVCRAIGEHGLQFLKELRARQHRHPQAAAERTADRSSVGLSPSLLNPEPRALNPYQILTHCNAGGLATAGYGTALAPIYVGAEHGATFHVYSDETRPLLQGSRITAYELQQNKIPVTVICDSMAAAVMSQKRIDAVIVGTDRVAANGDVANKIGTLNVAILARHFHIPFLVAAPTSSIDLSLESGARIPIEERNSSEISNGLGRQTAPDNVDFYNPAFDVTPASLVTAIITEHGIAHAPFDKSLAALCARSGSARAPRR